MEEWKEYKIGDIAKTNTSQYSLSENWETIQYLDTGSITKNQISGIEEFFGNIDLPSRARRKVKHGDIVYSCVRPNLCHYGYIDNPPANLLVSTGFAVITVDPNIADARYIYYFLTQNNIVQSLHTIGEQAVSTYPSIKASDIEDLSILLPSLPIQRQIASILSSLDDKIELNRKINANLEAQAQALFKSWFVDFEPFKDQPFVESELGMIPEGWKVGTFLDNVNVMPGGTPSTNKTEYWTDGAIPFFCPKDVNGVYCFKTEKNITELGLNNCSSHLYPKDTLFITARGTVGKLALAGLPMAMNQSNYALVAKEGISKFYLYLLAQTLIAVLLKKANGAVFSAITTRDFNEPTIIPPTLDIKHFDNLVSPIFNKIYQTEQESRRLASLRDTLLPRLMSGELKVNEVI